MIAKGNEKEAKNEGAGTFYGPRVVLPKTDCDKSGFCFDMAGTPGVDLQAVMTNCGGTKWCFLYRNMNNVSWVYENPNLSFKTLTGWMTTDTQAIYRIVINLPYAYSTYLINDEDGNKIAHYLNLWKDDAQNAMKTAKLECTRCANEYITNFQVLEAAKGTVKDLSDQKAKQLAEIEEINKNIKIQNDLLTALEGEINGLLAQVAEKKSNKTKIEQITSSLASDKAGKENAIKELDANAGNKEAATAKFTKIVEDNQSCVDTQLLLLKAQAPQPEPVKAWTLAKQAVTKRVITEYLGAIRKVYP